MVASIGQKVKYFRQVRKMSQRALARSAGVSGTLVCHLEAGVGHDPTLGHVLALARALDVPASQLIEDTPVGDPVDGHTADDLNLLRAIRPEDWPHVRSLIRAWLDTRHDGAQGQATAQPSPHYVAAPQHAVIPPHPDRSRRTAAKPRRIDRLRQTRAGMKPTMERDGNSLAASAVSADRGS
jgi:transcriptional regulator with XRE-family HTH domain